MHICHGSFGVNRNEKVKLHRDFSKLQEARKNSGPKEKRKKTKSNHITHIKEETIIKFQLKQLQ